MVQMTDEERLAQVHSELKELAAKFQPTYPAMTELERAELELTIRKRWSDKRQYGDSVLDKDDEYGSPACMMRAHEILALIDRCKPEDVTIMMSRATALTDTKEEENGPQD